MHVDVQGEWVMLWVAAMYNVAVLSMADMVYAETVEFMSSTSWVYMVCMVCMVCMIHMYMVCLICWSLSYVVKFYCC